MRLFAAAVAALAAYLVVAGIVDWRHPRPRRLHRRRRSGVQQRLDQLGADITVARYRAAIVGSGVGVFVVVVAATGTPSLAVPPAVAVASLPRVLLRRRHDKVLAARRGAWPEAIRDVVTHLSVGQPLHRSLCLLGHSGPPPLREVWRRYERNALAVDVPTALELVRAELADPVSDRVIEAFSAAHDHGREVIVAVLRSLADNVTRDLQVVEQIMTAQTEIRSQAVFAGVLPFVVLAFLVVSNDAYRNFYRTPGGWIVVMVGALMAIGGWKLIGLLGRIPSEERVLTRNVTSS